VRRIRGHHDHVAPFQVMLHAALNIGAEPFAGARLLAADHLAAGDIQRLAVHYE
jgi:hypothetical protein